MPILKKLKNQFDKLLSTKGEEESVDHLFSSSERELYDDYDIDSAIVGAAKPFRVDSDGEELLEEPSSSLSVDLDEEEEVVENEIEETSFYKQSKEAYSHGLDEIYNLEDVDISTVRTLDEGSLLEKDSFVESVDEHYPIEQEQFLFDFGTPFREWVDSLVLAEPLQVLGLSSQTELRFLENGKTTLGAIKKLSSQDLLGMQGVGQGHLDEVQKAVKSYLEGKPLHCVRKVDFKSFLLTLVGDLDKKSAFCFLEQVGLGYLITLSKEERAIVRHWTAARQKESAGKIGEVLAIGSRRDFMTKNLQQIFDAFLLPWMAQREGIAASYEIWERLDQVALEKSSARAFFDLLSQEIFKGSDLFENFLFPVERGVFCNIKEVEESYLLVLKRAKSYFYARKLSYPLDEMIGFLLREFSKEWLAHSPEFIRRVLWRSPTFRVRKNKQGILTVKYA